MQSAIFENVLLNASQAGVSRSYIPAFLYGCAWKKERTADLVYQALSSGFKGIDVAAQPRHYREDLAGEGLRRAITDGKVERQDIFLQTKFTSVDGQDPSNMPYDASASIPNQVETSIASSLRNLRSPESADSTSTYLDSLVLHSPLRTVEATLEAWKTCESYVPHKIRNLGISNVNLPVLQALYKRATVKPAVVQNRFYRDTQYDIPLRKFCRENGIVYQSFWTITANQNLIRHPSVEFIAKENNVDTGVALYALVMGLQGTVICNGTENHMVSDIEGLARIALWAKANEYDWENTMKKFKDATGDNNPGDNPVEASMDRQVFRNKNA